MRFKRIAVLMLSLVFLLHRIHQCTAQPQTVEAQTLFNHLRHAVILSAGGTPGGEFSFAARSQTAKSLWELDEALNDGLLNLLTTRKLHTQWMVAAEGLVAPRSVTFFSLVACLDLGSSKGAAWRPIYTQLGNESGRAPPTASELGRIVPCWQDDIVMQCLKGNVEGQPEITTKVRVHEGEHENSGDLYTEFDPARYLTGSWSTNTLVALANSKRGDLSVDENLLRPVGLAYETGQFVSVSGEIVPELDPPRLVLNSFGGEPVRTINALQRAVQENWDLQAGPTPSLFQHGTWMTHTVVYLEVILVIWAVGGYAEAEMRRKVQLYGAGIQNMRYRRLWWSLCWVAVHAISLTAFIVAFVDTVNVALRSKAYSAHMTFAVAYGERPTWIDELSSCRGNPFACRPYYIGFAVTLARNNLDYRIAVTLFIAGVVILLLWAFVTARIFVRNPVLRTDVVLFVIHVFFCWPWHAVEFLLVRCCFGNTFRTEALRKELLLRNQFGDAVDRNAFQGIIRTVSPWTIDRDCHEVREFLEGIVDALDDILPNPAE